MNKTTKKIKQEMSFEYHLGQRLKNKTFKAGYDEEGKKLEIAYQILQLRKNAKMSQATFAKRIGTTQSNVARMEQGNQNFTINLLNKVARALNRDLTVAFK